MQIMGVGLVRSLQPPDILWIHWGVYNSIANTSEGGILSAPFWCLYQKLSLSPLYFNKTLLHKSSERSSLVCGPRLNSSPPEAKNPGVFAWFNNFSNLPAMQETWVRFLGWEDPLEKEMAIRSSILAWKIPWTEKLGGLQSMGSQESDTT